MTTFVVVTNNNPKKTKHVTPCRDGKRNRGSSIRPPISPVRRMTSLDGDTTGTHPSTMTQLAQQPTKPSQSTPINLFWTPPLAPILSQAIATAIANCSQTSQTPSMNSNNQHGNQTMVGSHFSSGTPMSHHNYYQNPYATPYPYGYLGGPAQQSDFSTTQQGKPRQE